MCSSRVLLHESDSAAASTYMLHCTYTVSACAISRIAWDYEDRGDFRRKVRMRVRLGKLGNVRSDGYVQAVGVLRARARGMDARRAMSWQYCAVTYSN